MLVVGALAFAGCGSGVGDGDDDEGGLRSFCVEWAILVVLVGSTPIDVDATLDRLARAAEHAPPEIADDVQRMSDVFNREDVSPTTEPSPGDEPVLLDRINAFVEAECSVFNEPTVP